jgi:transcriptional regulator with XRE-family HTH domain
LTEEYIAIVDKMKAQRQKCGKSYQQLASEVGISESTVIRILTRKSEKASISDVIALWKAMGGNATELFDDTVKVDVVSEAPQVVVPQIDERLYSEIISIYKDLLKVKDKRINTLLTFLGVLSAAMIALTTLFVLL